MPLHPFIASAIYAASFALIAIALGELTAFGIANRALIVFMLLGFIFKKSGSTSLAVFLRWSRENMLRGMTVVVLTLVFMVFALYVGVSVFRSVLDAAFAFVFFWALFYLLGR
jgi:hypothetical protein